MTPQRRDIIFNPFDVRSHAWDFWKEVESDIFLGIIASALFDQNKSIDQFWAKTSKIVFIDAVGEFRKTQSIKELHKFLTQNTLKDLFEALRHTSSRGIIEFWIR